MPNDLISVHEAAQLTGRHWGVIYRWIRDGDLPAYGPPKARRKRGEGRKVSKAAVLALVEVQPIEQKEQGQ